MQIEKLRSLIRESVKDHIKEIEAVAEAAAMEARLAEYGKAIETCESKITKAESLEEVQDLVDEGKLNELKKKLKDLKKAKEKLEKQKAKKNKGKEVTTDAKADKMDETYTMDENDDLSDEEKEELRKKAEQNPSQALPENDDLSDEEKEELRKKAEQNPSLALPEGKINESFLKMQKLAGVITEGQYRKKVQMLNEADNVDFNLTEVDPNSKEIRDEMLRQGLKVTVDVNGKTVHNESSATGTMIVNKYGILIGVLKSANKAQEILKFVENKFKDKYTIEKRPSGGDFWEFNMKKKEVE